MKDREISMLILGIVGVGVVMYLLQDDCYREHLQIDSPRTMANRPENIKSRYLRIQDRINKNKCKRQADIDEFNSVTNDLNRMGKIPPDVKAVLKSVDKTVTMTPMCTR